jgi:hypothetical protein
MPSKATMRPQCNERSSKVTGISHVKAQDKALVDNFDPKSGNLLERILFRNRIIVLIICLLVTVVLGFQATKLELNAGFEKMIPTKHPFITNYLKYKDELKGLGNSIRIAVETKEGTIFDPGYLETLRDINDDVIFIPGVDRSFVKSLWTRSVRWMAVTSDGFDSGPVMPESEDINELRKNVERAGLVGQMVSPDLKSSVVIVPLLEVDTSTGKRLNYATLSRNLDELRQKYSQRNVVLHITGFAKIVGDLIEGLQRIVLFFLAAIVIAMLILYSYTRCARSTLLVVGCSLIAVLWQLGLLATFGFELDPYAVLVPFLVFAIGMSTGAQKMNGIMLDIGRGASRLVAARLTFRRLFVPGVTALLSDAVGFTALLIIKIQVIQDLAVAASLGVATLIFTNLMVVPLILSFTGVNPKAAARSVQNEMDELAGKEPSVAIWTFLGVFTRRRGAAIAVVICALMGVSGLYIRSNLKIGDLDPGAPELRPHSRYNQDNAFMVKNYAASSDVLVVMVKSKEYEGTSYKNLSKMDELEWQLQQVKGVKSTKSQAGVCRRIISAMHEGSLKWYDLVPNDSMVRAAVNRAPDRELFNYTYDLLSVFVFLNDHKADTLTGVVNNVKEFASQNNTKDQQFLLAAGSAGIEAATNIVVKGATHKMLYFIYGAVILLCYITFRSWLAVLATVLPLMLTSVLCEVLMVWLGIGVKVATLPVIALGVGVGVDYALYVVSVILDRLRCGMSLSESYQATLRFTGKIVVLIGITLSISVGIWAFSPIKFQADMGILLAFMFLWNMVGALVLLPALLYFLRPVREKKSAKCSTAVGLS